MHDQRLTWIMFVDKNPLGLFICFYFTCDACIHKSYKDVLIHEII